MKSEEMSEIAIHVFQRVRLILSLIWEFQALIDRLQLTRTLRPNRIRHFSIIVRFTSLVTDTRNAYESGYYSLVIRIPPDNAAPRATALPGQTPTPDPWLIPLIGGICPFHHRHICIVCLSVYLASLIL